MLEMNYRTIEDEMNYRSLINKMKTILIELLKLKMHSERKTSHNEAGTTLTHLK